MPAEKLFAQVRETHTGLVILCGNRAYKVKKPVVTDFLDFGTRELRERACAREIMLNRRLAPDVYLGLAHLEGPAADDDEPVVVMRRMPEDTRLANSLTDPVEGPGELTELAELLAGFHRSATRNATIDHAGTLEAVRRRWRALTRSLDPGEASQIDRRAMRYLDGRGPLLADRIAEHRIVDGHGDLLAEDIFRLSDGFRVLDCLDFDDELRHLDGLDDVAFLAMDLEFRGRPDLADQFLDDYLRAADDPAPRSLRDHYIAYRAFVRAKVDAIRHAQGDPSAHRRLRAHLDLAMRHLTEATIRLAIVGGRPEAGKSTVAAMLADVTGSVLLSGDTVHIQPREEGTAVGDAGAAFVGGHLLDEARVLLEHGRSVIIDAEWADESDRVQARAVAAATHTDLIELHCVRVTPRADTFPRTGARWPAATELDVTAIDEATATALQVWRNSSKI